MAAKIKKLPFPDFLLTHKCLIKLDEQGLDENGSPKTALSVEAECMFSDCLSRAYTKDGKAVGISGKVIVKGDVAPKLDQISSGTVCIGRRTMQIYAATRVKNPNGTVHHTELLLQ